MGSMKSGPRNPRRSTGIQLLQRLALRNLYHNYYYQNPKSLMIGYLDPRPYGLGFKV